MFWCTSFMWICIFISGIKYKSGNAGSYFNFFLITLPTKVTFRTQSPCCFHSVPPSPTSSETSMVWYFSIVFTSLPWSSVIPEWQFASYCQFLEDRNRLSHFCIPQGSECTTIYKAGTL